MKRRVPTLKDVAGLADVSVQTVSSVVNNTHDDIDRETNFVEPAMQRWIDGALFVSAADQMESLDRFAAAERPTVAIDRVPEGYNGPWVTLNHREGGRIAAEHLLGLGHTDIAHISGPRRLRLVRERMAGYQEAIRARGLTPGLCAGGEGNWAPEWGYQAMQEILEHRPRPTGVFAANDRTAIGALRAIYEAGLRVPEDISVVGLDDIELAAYQIPPLTTVRQSFADLATQAVHLLLEILKGRQPEQTQFRLEPELVVRRSTAPPVSRSWKGGDALEHRQQ